MFCKEYILKNFAKSTEKYLCQILFYNKAAELRPATTTLWKKRLRHKFLSENLDNFFLNLFFYRTPPMVTSSYFKARFVFFLSSFVPAFLSLFSTFFGTFHCFSIIVHWYGRKKGVPEAYSEPRRTSTAQLFCETVDGF